ncbi:MAG: hypothetical protein ACI4UA_05955 [Bacteroidaceae bacterium]
MNNREYIIRHRNEDVRMLALRRAEPGVDVSFCLRQIEAWQKACTKLPRWADTDDIIFPPRINMEQCSSQATAEYKRNLILRLLPEHRSSMVDLTGGFGVDFSFLSPLFDKAVYVERDSDLCQIASHNLPLLGASHAQVICAQAECFLEEVAHQNLLFLDPARRDDAGRKVVALHDCSPNVEALSSRLLSLSDVVMVKLSPMLDIGQALQSLPNVCEVHTVSVDGECRELLLVLSASDAPLSYHCVNLGRQQQIFITKERHAQPLIASAPDRYLYEPNASIMKAGVQDALCQTYHVAKLHPFSHLFTSGEICDVFPGRRFLVEDFTTCGKRELKSFLRDVSRANLSVRNFPSTVASLRKQWHLAEGGDVYLFATTLSDGTHVLIRCRKV